MPETTYLQLLNLTHFSSQCVRNYTFQILGVGGQKRLNSTDLGATCTLS